MTKRLLIIGILSFVMLSSFWSFYKEALVYNPLEGILQAGTPREERLKPPDTSRYVWGAEIAGKNLFSAMRGKIPVIIQTPEPVEPEIPVIEIPELKLDGIIVNQFGEYVVYILKDREAIPPLRKGDRYDDLYVLDIREKSVDLLWDEQEIRLTMEKMRKH